MKHWRTESELQRDFTRWLRSPGSEEFRSSCLRGVGAGAFELKLVRPGAKGRAALAYSALEEGQRDALLKAVGSKHDSYGAVVPLAYKISDSGIGYKPFDCFVMQGCAAGVVVGYAKGCRDAAGASVAGQAWYVGIEELEVLRAGRGRGSWSLENIRMVGEGLTLR